MLKEIIATGKDVTEAQETARAALGAGPLDEVNFEIIELGSRGIFGIIGVKPAKVRATMEVADAKEPKRSRPQSEKASESAEREPSEKSEKSEKRSSGKKKNRKNNENRRQQNDETAAVDMTVGLTKREVMPGEDMSFEFIKSLIADTSLECEAELYSQEDGTRRIIISGKDASVLIGHHGDTLDAVQYLANLASARKNINGERDKSRVTIDIEGYRAKREQTLRALARRKAAACLRQKRSIKLEPMSAYERRIIHSEVQGIEGVSTSSVGSDNNRQVVIFLTDKKPREIFDDEETVTPLSEEFAPDADDVTASVGAIEQSVPAEGADESETLTVESTHPAEDFVSFSDDDK